MTAGFVVNPSREAAVECAGELVRWLQARSVSVRLQAATAPLVGLESLAADDEEVGAGDFIVALGGDGTLLSASRIAACHDTPILGIHEGGPASFGFLTETT